MAESNGEKNPFVANKRTSTIPLGDVRPAAGVFYDPTPAVIPNLSQDDLRALAEAKGDVLAELKQPVLEAFTDNANGRRPNVNICAVDSQIDGASKDAGGVDKLGDGALAIIVDGSGKKGREIADRAHQLLRQSMKLLETNYPDKSPDWIMAEAVTEVKQHLRDNAASISIGMQYVSKQTNRAFMYTEGECRAGFVHLNGSGVAQQTEKNKVQIVRYDLQHGDRPFLVSGGVSGGFINGMLPASFESAIREAGAPASALLDVIRKGLGSRHKDAMAIVMGGSRHVTEDRRNVSKSS